MRRKNDNLVSSAYYGQRNISLLFIIDYPLIVVPSISKSANTWPLRVLLLKKEGSGKCEYVVCVVTREID